MSQASCRIEKLKLLSKLEEAGVLSTLEKSGITLEFIEENKLLSKAENAGAISLLTDRCARTSSCHSHHGTVEVLHDHQSNASCKTQCRRI